ncbi:MAG: hypothetical protein Q8920_08945 [Bacillota bacterium]|nr:hypothetical protein [Bacillota bacterium]
MKTLVIKPWPFKKDEIACLQWIGSPFQSESNQWFINCVFNDTNGNTKQIELPFGTLPGIKIGRKYKNGIWVDNEDSKETIQVDIPKDTTFQICSLSEIPKKLNDVNGETRFNNDLLCHFRIGENNYYVPCMEVVGSILAPYQAFINKILTPSGLEDFIEAVEPGLNIINIKFTAEYPKKLLKPEVVAYFAWLRFNKDARREWNAVYKNLLARAAETLPLFPALALITALPLKAVPPLSTDSTWKFKGTSYINNFLIQEITYRSGLDPVFASVKYSHPDSITGNKGNSPGLKSNKRRKYKEGETSQFVDNIGLPSRKKRSSMSIKQQEAQFIFTERVDVEKIRNKSKSVNSGRNDNRQINFNNNSKESINIGTTQDWTLEGKFNQIEFFLLQMVRENFEKGLEKFFKALEYVKKYYRSIDFEISVVYMPTKRTFSLNDNGTRRRCAIIKAYNRSVFQCYILELSRNDEWPISTLFIRPISTSYTNDEFESLINKLLYKVIENGGHWDATTIDSIAIYRFEISKHIMKIWGQLTRIDKIIQMVYNGN